MTPLETMAKQSERFGYKTQIVETPDWMKPWDKMLVVKTPAGFIYQVIVYNSQTQESKISK